VCECVRVCVFVHEVDGVSVFVVFESVCMLDVRIGLFCGCLCWGLVVVFVCGGVVCCVCCMCCWGFCWMIAMCG